ncbi:PilC/PilY family type IV pilus protein [Neisseriaceae bacterium TC5R-5]|nr:PilC/PilY family type IV pilus protein [Neisseriaceae bacterium TC5R-5]
MTRAKPKTLLRLSVMATACLFAWPAHALIVTDNFTGINNQQNWNVIGNACLTASSNSSPGSGQIPGCPSGQVGGYNGTFPDPSGNGALRLTNSANYQRGAIIYNSWFPTDSGISVTWTSYTYNGDSGGSAGNGADGMSFFLISNPSGSTSAAVPTNIGATGGSLGYSCSNGNTASDGMPNGYLGVGMDEYGNFTNKSDNTSTGPAYSPLAIAMRGAGNVNLSWLNSSSYAQYYSTRDYGTIQSICKSGTVKSSSKGATTAVPNYAFIPISGLPSSQNGIWKVSEGPMAIQPSNTTRPKAIPISYRLQITPENLLSFWYSYNGGAYRNVINSYDISNPAVSGALPEYVTFGFAGSTGGSRNVHEITCFQAAPQTTSGSSAGVNTQQSAQIQTGSQAYLAYYHSDNWWGQIASYPLVVNSSTNAVSLSTTATWDASCVLTGGACSATGASSGSAQSSSARKLITWNSSSASGVPFQWSNLSSAQQSALNSTDNQGSNRLAYLRGDRSNEITSSGSGLFRTRDGVLGDIINASPVWVGAPAQSYNSTWKDNINSSASLPENATGASSYASFISSNATRANIVYVGANDGMLHGFRSGAYTSSGTYSTSTTPNDGQEVLGYVPNAVLSNTDEYSSNGYGHQYFVDATPGSGDLFYNNSWRTWLVGGLGAGGQALYALDVTTPSTFSESRASSILLGEWTPSSISCVNKTNCGNDLGYLFGTPVITRFHNGSWGAIFGNGYKSNSGVGAIFIMMVNPTSGAITFYEYSTGYGASQDPSAASTPNGIYQTTAVDLDGDSITDYIYAGDLFGNVWRFDVTNSNPTQWGVSSYGGSAKPVFATPASAATSSASAILRPITTKINVGSITASATNPRVMLYFGTGQKIPFTTTSSSIYASGSQAFYGVWDWNMSGWNSLSTTQYATPVSGTPTVPLAASNLVAQTRQTTIASSSTTVQNYASLSSNPVCWAGSTACSAGNTQYGWTFTFPNSTEQLLYNPQNYLGAILFNTTIPANNSPLLCSTGTDTGWSYALNPATGGNFSKSFFTNDQSGFTGVSGYTINAVQGSAVGSFQPVTYNGASYLVYQTSLGQVTGNVLQVNPYAANQAYRLTWVELR